MPELPEVETVKNVLSKIVIGNTITDIDVYRERQIEGDVDLFKAKLKGQTFLSLSRIGKYLIFHLTNELVIISHLRMEGKYFEYLESEPDSKYARVVFHFNNGHKLCYDDSRTFGVLKLTDEASYLKDKGIMKLGPEPWDCDINLI
nr:DNA-formamidopyrimidine glycosylase [Bacilli bacterium]